MQVTWVIQNNSVEDNVATLAAIIEKQKGVAKVVPYRPFEDVNVLDFPPADVGPIFAAGSISWIKNIQKRAAWVPGPIATWRNYDCDVYYAHYGRYLLNKDYIMLPLGELYHRFDEIFNLLGASPLFTRPASGLKQFTGEVFYTQKDLREFYESCNKELLCVIAPKQDIYAEYRLICTKDSIVTGSLYRQQNQIKRRRLEIKYKPDLIAHLFTVDFLKEVSWIPDPIFVVDVAIQKFTNSDSYIASLLEINAVSSSGWYECDQEALINAINEVAIAGWKDIYDGTN